MKPVQPEMSAERMRAARSPLDQRDLRRIAKALAVKDEHQAYDIVRGYSPGELPRDVQILLESLFE